ncbi:hypothetical protein [Rhizobium rhizosphaerae]|nr:hypothetical protein [Xaviernesmea rhizosphaerae]
MSEGGSSEGRLQRWNMLARFSGIFSALIYSGANFLIVFLLQSQVSRLEFGVFALSQVFLQFGGSLCMALFATPIQVHAARPEAWRANFGSFSKANLLCAVLFGALSAAIVEGLGAGRGFAALFLLLVVLSAVRLFLRSAELARENYRPAMLADAVYGAVVLAGAGLLLVSGRMSNVSVVIVQILGCLTVCPILPAASRLALETLGTASLTPYLHSLRDHGRWLLLNVLTTEATANAHSYLVGFLLGPSAYAPIAALTLLYRPANIVVQAMTQYERPRMAAALLERQRDVLRGAVRLFRGVSLGICFVNIVLVAAILWLLPGLIGTGAYDRDELVLAAAFLAVITLARSLRGPETAALQAGAHFRALSMASVYAAPISLIGTTLIVLALPPGHAALSLAGIAIGEFALTFLCARLYARRFA